MVKTLLGLLLATSAAYAAPFRVELSPNQLPRSVYEAATLSVASGCKDAQLPVKIYYSTENLTPDSSLNTYWLIFSKYTVEVFTQYTMIFNHERVMSIQFDDHNCR